jgi:hypothetical protein
LRLRRHPTFQHKEFAHITALGLSLLVSETVAMSEPTTPTEQRWVTPGVRGIGTAGFLADVGDEIPTALFPASMSRTVMRPARP